MEIIALILFLSIILVLLTGYPVAFVLGGLSFIIGVPYLGIDFFHILPMRFMGIMSNHVLMAVPLFIFMGITLQKSGIAERMLVNMSKVFGSWNGGLAVSVILVGALLAASTGIVGATVVTMGLISLPAMLNAGYSHPLSSGIVTASGTLGQIIPPSIVLILLGSVLSISVGDLFYYAFFPGVALVLLYLIYVVSISFLRPHSMGSSSTNRQASPLNAKEILNSFVLPLLLIIIVLGSIYWGIASPTEAAAVGSSGALILAWTSRKMSISQLIEISKETSLLTSMVFFTLLGATCFALVFRGLGGDDFITDFLLGWELHPFYFVLLLMVLVFLLGFIIDFIEIIFILVPVVLPILKMYEINLIWVGILLAINIQSSFLTPPFGFSLFYLRGVAPEEVRTQDIYRGSIPFLLIQLLVLTILMFYPSFFGLKMFVD